MSIFGKLTRNPFKGRDFMELVPERLVAHEEVDGGAAIVLLVPRFRDPVGSRLLQPRLPAERRWIRVRMDEKGARIWREIDGTRSVGELLPGFRAWYPDLTADVAELLSQWMYAAYQNKLVNFRNL